MGGARDFETMAFEVFDQHGGQTLIVVDDENAVGHIPTKKGEAAPESTVSPPRAPKEEERFLRAYWLVSC